MFLTKNRDASDALQVFLGLREPTSSLEKTYVYPDDSQSINRDMPTAEQQWLADAVTEFSHIELDRPNHKGDSVWAAINSFSDAYRVGALQVLEKALYVSRLEVMSFCVPELERLDSVTVLDEGQREHIDQCFDEIAEGEFLPRENAIPMIEMMIEVSHRDGNVNGVGDKFYEPIYQLIESWSESDTNCQPQPFFETDLFRNLWEVRQSSIVVEQASATLDTYFWYRKRDHSGTYAVTTRDAPVFVAKLATLADRLGERGFKRLRDRSKSRFDEQQDEMDAIEEARYLDS